MYVCNSAFVYVVIGGFEEKRSLPSIEVLAVMALDSVELLEFNKWIEVVCDVCECMYDRGDGVFVMSDKFYGSGGFTQLQEGGLIDINPDAYDGLSDMLLFYMIFDENAGNFFIALLGVYDEVVWPFNANEGGGYT